MLRSQNPALSLQKTQGQGRGTRQYIDLDRSSGNMSGAHDLILASIALERGSVVATLNKRHFVLVPGLRVVEPK